MGWRDRDYAQWTDEERRLFYGSRSPTHPARSGYSTGRGQGRLFGARKGVAPRTFLAVFVSLVVALALGQLPRSHPLFPWLRLSLPATAAKTGTVSLPSNLPLGSYLTLHGGIPADESGTVMIEGAFDQAHWKILATVPAEHGAYAARIPLNQRGRLHLRVTYPDGHVAVGETEVG